MANSFAEREKNINNDINNPHNETMKLKRKMSFLEELAGIPSWVLAILTWLIALIFLFFENNHQREHHCIVVFCWWVLSIIVSIINAHIGRKKAFSGN